MIGTGRGPASTFNWAVPRGLYYGSCLRDGACVGGHLVGTRRATCTLACGLGYRCSVQPYWYAGHRRQLCITPNTVALIRAP